MREIRPDKLLIIPDRLPPHKELAPGSPIAENRLHLCELCFADIPGVVVDDLELQRPGKSYTKDTIRQLTEQYPGWELYLVVGSDMLLSFTEWNSFEYILGHVTLVCVSRRVGDRPALEVAAEQLRTRYGAKVRILDTEPLMISSSEIRKRLQSGEAEDLLVPAVAEAIKKNSFYGR